MTMFHEPGHQSHARLYRLRLDGAIRVRASGIYKDDPSLSKVPSFFHEAIQKGFRSRPRYRFIDHSVIAGVGVCHLQIAKLYIEQIRFHCSNGHGFAAELGNHLFDKIGLKDSRILGDDNAKQGPDRYVDGIHIQSKYCATGKGCIDECFSAKGSFKYLNKDGTIMQIEVPSDMYGAAVEAMREKIKAGRVPGVTNPDKASDIVREGSLTYQQAVNIARFGTIESLTFDAINGIKMGLVAGSLSAAVAFGLAVFSGEPVGKALRQAAWVGFKVGGYTLAISVITSQIGRTAFEQAFREVSKDITRHLSNKAASALVEAMTGKVLQGNAARVTLAKVLRGNLASIVITAVVMSVPDIMKTFRGQISGVQLTKNLSKIAGGVAAGYGGGVAGAIVGTFFFPVIGSYVGGVVGTCLGGYAGATGTGAVMDNVIIDDTVGMLVILEQELVNVVTDFCLVKGEVEALMKGLVSAGIPKLLENMFAQRPIQRPRFAYDHIEGLAKIELRKRKPVRLPSQDEMVRETGTVVGEFTAECDAGTLDAQNVDSKVYTLGIPFSQVFHEAFKDDYEYLSPSIMCGPGLKTDKGRKKLGNALNSYGRKYGGVPIHSVLAVVDTTTFGSATDGAIFTSEAVWIKNAFSSPFSLPYESFNEDVKMHDGSLYLTKGKFIGVPCVYARNDIGRLITLIKAHFQRP